MITYFAIKHKQTGKFMPQGLTSATRWTPSEHSTDEPPRLFKTKRAAISSKNWWLKGWVTLDEEGGWTVMNVQSARVRDRSPDDLIILEVTVTPTGQLEFDL